MVISVITFYYFEKTRPKLETDILFFKCTKAGNKLDIVGFLAAGVVQVVVGYLLCLVVHACEVVTAVHYYYVLLVAILYFPAS